MSIDIMLYKYNNNYYNGYILYIYCPLTPGITVWYTIDAMEEGFLRRCLAMKAAGIGNPESQEGIDFCTKRCPYPNKCVAMETKRGLGEIAEWRAATAKEMFANGVDIKDIATNLGVSARSVYRYLGL